MAQFVNGPEAENIPDDLDILRDESEDGDDNDSKPDDKEPKEIDTEDKEEPDPEETDEEEEELDEEVDEKEDEKEEEDETDPNAKVGAPFSDRPTWRQLNEKYPKLFKDFPGLRNAYFREAEFSKRFPTVEDADEAIEKLTILQEGEQRISTGDPNEFLKMLKDFGDPKVERRFIGNFLPALFHQNRPAFQAITQPILKNVLRGAMQAGKQHGNENLQNSALHLHEFIFGDVDIEKGLPNPMQANEKTDDPERKEFEEQRNNFLRTQQRDFQEHVLGVGTRGIDRVIDEAIPEDASSFEKKAFISDVKTKLANALMQDTAHISMMSRIQKQAERAGYSKEYKDRAASAYLSRAKLALPAIIKEVRSDFLKDKRQKPNHPRRATSNGARPPMKKDEKASQDKEKAVLTGKMSERDFLASD